MRSIYLGPAWPVLTQTPRPLTVADQIPPTITASATKGDGTYYSVGTWTAQTVTVQFACPDNPNGSGIPAGTCPANQVFASDGVVAATGTVTDAAGNAASVSLGPIQIDKAAPTLNVTVTPPRPPP